MSLSISIKLNSNLKIAENRGNQTMQTFNYFNEIPKPQIIIEEIIAYFLLSVTPLIATKPTKRT